MHVVAPGLGEPVSVVTRDVDEIVVRMDGGATVLLQREGLLWVRR